MAQFESQSLARFRAGGRLARPISVGQPGDRWQYRLWSWRPVSRPTVAREMGRTRKFPCSIIKRTNPVLVLDGRAEKGMLCDVSHNIFLTSAIGRSCSSVLTGRQSNVLQFVPLFCSERYDVGYDDRESILSGCSVCFLTCSGFRSPRCDKLAKKWKLTRHLEAAAVRFFICGPHNSLESSTLEFSRVIVQCGFVVSRLLLPQGYSILPLQLDAVKASRHIAPWPPSQAPSIHQLETGGLFSFC